MLSAELGVVRREKRVAAKRITMGDLKNSFGIVVHTNDEMFVSADHVFGASQS